MGVFDKIKGAIFGHKESDPSERRAGSAGSPQLQQPAPQVQAQQHQGGATTTAAPAPQQQPVDVEAVLADISRQRGNPGLNYQSSIVDLMKLLGIDSNLENRKELAQELGYGGQLDGSAEMNIWLHKAVMKGLADNGGKVPSSMLF